MYSTALSVATIRPPRRNWMTLAAMIGNANSSGKKLVTPPVRKMNAETITASDFSRSVRSMAARVWAGTPVKAEYSSTQ